MYLIYETYTDETRNMRDLRFNTRIVGVYESKRKAKDEFDKHLEDIQLDFTEDNDWYIKKFDKKLAKEQNENIIEVYEVFNEYVDNCGEVFYVILEKVESDLNDNEL